MDCLSEQIKCLDAYIYSTWGANLRTCQLLFDEFLLSPDQAGITSTAVPDLFITLPTAANEFQM